jgi:hypothetical protein
MTDIADRLEELCATHDWCLHCRDARSEGAAEIRRLRDCALYFCGKGHPFYSDRPGVPDGDGFILNLPEPCPVCQNHALREKLGQAAKVAGDEARELAGESVAQAVFHAVKTLVRESGEPDRPQPAREGE